MINRNYSPGTRNNSDSEETLKTILKNRVHDARKRAKRKNMPCDITVDDLVKLYRKQGGLCYLSGQKLSLEMHNNYTISIDRVDSRKGYTRENVGLCCWISNQCKNNLTLEEFYKWCSLISDNSMVA